MNLFKRPLPGAISSVCKVKPSEKLTIDVGVTINCENTAIEAPACSTGILVMEITAFRDIPIAYI